ncbi:MAG: glucuronate isomerase [Bacteroidota bacterium]
MHLSSTYKSPAGIKPFLSEDFLLENETANRLYHEYAKEMPIIDYHNHLPPDEIASNKQFQTLTEIWLKGDHYKWRAMRANGVAEEYITGDTDDYTKFAKWADTVPYTMRNPLYHWTHMELKNPFGIDKLLVPGTAQEIYETCNELLQDPEFSTQGLLRRARVRALCTTDDPADSLEHHRTIAESPFEIRVFPSFRPDKVMQTQDPLVFKEYLTQLGEAADISIHSWTQLLDALKKRHAYFHEMGCRVSDHGLETFYAQAYTEREIQRYFETLLAGNPLNRQQQAQFSSAVLYHCAIMDFEKGWTQQFHIGALRNTNQHIIRKLGKDAGCDSIGDWNHTVQMAKFFDRLNREEKLAKTIVYNLNPRDNESFATMMGNFNDGTIPGKMQFGTAWWFLDQKDGMIAQMNTLSNLGLLSRFVGMLTDSRSFLSFSRHEYFRRILCNLIGKDVHKGELPHDIEWLGKMVQDICFTNAHQYFQLPE